MDIYYNIISPPSRALALLMSNLGLLSVSWKSLDLLAGEQLAPEFVAINPQHCVPTLVDGDVVLWESNAIMVYLAEKYQIPEPGYPRDPVRRALMFQRMFFDVGTLHKAITDCYSHQVVTGKQEKGETAAKKLDEVLKILDGFLAKGKFVAGDTLNLADFSIAGTMSILTLVEHDLSSYEQITRWQNLCSEKMSGYGGLMDEAKAEWPKFLENLKKKL
ncbi:glutathione S-transferase D7 [Culex quinquefasciatus]|uniref:glutathione transferase n=1 Tax=Culex quinquefasciatus TaxID=7176 RepID=B0W6C5_CULQU|nr:glutathione S-transferase 2-like [Culex pipiens pallens]EDS36599.1 glutathione S-transferase D7 [Culex quinquefasciatus]|eukprot:XP_001844259.1 glutathione S-transferase D7 [Culex quinquefasciatus]